MKIQDLITLEKMKSKKQKYMWENKIQLEYEKKKGYYWRTPTHSQNQSILLNNYEKECVIAYINNKYFIAFLIKVRGKNNFKSFIYLKDFLDSIPNSYAYTISSVYKQDIIKAFQKDEENLKIVEKIEYNQFIKLMVFRTIRKIKMGLINVYKSKYEYNKIIRGYELK